MVKAEKTEVYTAVKVITAILVVIGHVAVMYTDDGAIPVLGASRVLAAVTKVIYRFHMPLFFFISGCVYAHNVAAGKYAHRPSFIAKKSRRLMIPYIAVGVLTVAPVMEALGLTEQSFFIYCLDGLILSRNPRHLWFLFALFLIFISAALARPFFILSPAGTFAVALVLHAAVRHTPVWLPGVFQIYNACVNAVFFFGGALADRYLPTLLQMFEKRRAATLIICAASAALLIIPFDIGSDLIYAAAGAFISLYIAYTLCKVKPIKDSLLYKLAARDTFGLYLFHPMINYIVFWLFRESTVSPFIISAVAFTVSTVAAVAVTEALRARRLAIFIGETNKK